VNPNKIGKSGGCIVSKFATIAPHNTSPTLYIIHTIKKSFARHKSGKGLYFIYQID